MLGRVKYHKSSKARHAKDVQPVSVDELHEIAAEMFKDKRSEVLGWQLLWEGSTGLRTNEVLLLRRDAEPRAFFAGPDNSLRQFLPIRLPQHETA